MPPAAHRPLAVFADDWGRHPSSCQHLARHLLARREVVWVNTLGTRPPRLDRATAGRAAGKLAGWFLPKKLAAPRADGPAPRVLSPKMWPSFRSRAARLANRELLVRALKPAFAALPEPPVILTTLPIVADLVGRLPAARWVYYCVDDFSVWPGYDGATMGRLERELVPKMDACVAVSETLVSHLKSLGADATLLTHGVDLDAWRAPVDAGPPPEWAGVGGPVALFWGVIDRRLDVEFVRRIAAESGATLVLVGPREDPDPALDSVPNVVVRPAVPFARLPALAQRAAVLVMPYADLPVTRAMQPLKMKEYLATGRPAVVRRLPATSPWADALDVASTAGEFARLVRERIISGLPPAQAAARERLRDEGWAAKAAVLEAILFPGA